MTKNLISENERGRGIRLQSDFIMIILHNKEDMIVIINIYKINKCHNHILQ